jgi:hypothetical protein
MKKNLKYLALVGLVLAFLIHYGCPAFFGYNITGVWAIFATYTQGGNDDWTVSFDGDRKSGSCTLSGGGTTITGTYQVNGKDVDFEVSASDGLIIFQGTFTDRNSMGGDGTLLLYSPESPLAKLLGRQARSNALSESWTFVWTGDKM